VNQFVGNPPYILSIVYKISGVYSNRFSQFRSKAIMTTEEKQSTLDLVASLCKALKDEKINYCHWKSNVAIDRSASGENDLDLLVSRADAQRFIGILMQLDFKEAFLTKGGQLPGTRDYYGYDQKADRIIHAHVHFQLVLGHDLSKNYHIPIENPFLESATQGGLFRIPAPEFELAIFVVRMVLKHSTLDAIIMGHGTLSASERRELEVLQSLTTLTKVAAVFDQHLPCVDNNLFEACLRSLQPGCSFWKRIVAGQQLQQKLRSCARRPLIGDTVLKFSQRIILPIQSRLHACEPKKHLIKGGLLIAVVGGDGSGKTTVVNSLYARIFEEFEIAKFHMGKPSWSWTTFWIRGIIKIGRMLGFYPFVKEGSESSFDTNIPIFPGYPWLIREVCTARDRFLTYTAARRLATNGCLVICDRYPLAEVKKMDGPQVERITHGMHSNKLIKALAGLENQYYEQIMLPDLLIVLRVAPDIAVQRKTDEPAESVRSRAGEVWNVDWGNTPAHIVDASRTKTEIHSDLMALIWSYL
jgi:thymidylate kinase